MVRVGNMYFTHLCPHPECSTMNSMVKAWILSLIQKSKQYMLKEANSILITVQIYTTATPKYSEGATTEASNTLRVEPSCSNGFARKKPKKQQTFKESEINSMKSKQSSE